MVTILGKNNSLLNQFITELRDVTIQRDRLRFRKNLERLGEIFAYEISRTLEYEHREVTTPLGVATMPLLREQPVLSAIFRAGLPLHQGMLNYFDQADNAFISAYRKYTDNNKFEICMEYVACPNLTNRVLIISDVMLATGSSAMRAYGELLKKGKPRHTHIVAVLASAKGVDFLVKHFSGTAFTLWVGAIDDKLTKKAYIVPGLGDAGDLAFGKNT